MDWELRPRNNGLNSVLLCGYPKTGNTWARFVILNYFNIVNHNAKKTLTYKELTKIQSHRVERDVKKEYKKFEYNPFQFEEGFPPLYHTHVSKGNWKYGEYFNKFDKLCYLYRNPCDTMISYYHYLMDRDNPFKGRKPRMKVQLLKNLQTFVKYYISEYIQHIKETMPHADLVLRYNELREDPYLFRDAIDLFGVRVSEEALEKAISFSSFDSIKRMGRETNQTYGLAKSYRGEFTRDGRVGQYKTILTNETIQFIKIKIREMNNEMREM